MSVSDLDRAPGIRPRPSVWRRLDAAARRAFPAASTALLLLLTAAPLGVPGQAEIQASIALICVWFWSLYRAASMPPAMVFLLGLLDDLLCYAPPGVGVLTLLLVHGLATRWGRGLMRRGFVVIWLAFLGIAAGAALLEWALTCLLTFRLLWPGPALFQAAISFGLFPLLAVPLEHANRTLAEPASA